MDPGELAPLKLLIRRFPVVPIRGQVNQPGRSRPEAASIEVKRGQALFEVDMEPLATCRLGVPGSGSDKRGGNTPPLLLTSNLGI